MSRSGYHDDHDDWWDLIKWRGQVASATRGRRGQRLFRELDALEPAVIAALIDDAVLSLRDGRRWKRAEQREARGRKRLRDLADTV